MQKLVCDVCGGNIQIQAGGKEGVCEYCGATYTMDRLREILSGIKVSQTGSAEDVEQWRKLVEKYYTVGAYQDAENIVKKILEAVPDDLQANHQYDELQSLKYFDIRNGVLVAYSGREARITTPKGIRQINVEVFESNYVEPYLEELVFSEGVESVIGYGRVLRSIKKVSFPTTIKEIGDGAFIDCKCLEDVSFELPSSLEVIGGGAFKGCSKLQSIIIPDSVNEIGLGAFDGCVNLVDIQHSSKLSSDLFFGTGYSQRIFEQMQRIREDRQKRGRCPDCDVALIGILKKRCPNCGKSF